MTRFSKVTPLANAAQLLRLFAMSVMAITMLAATSLVATSAQAAEKLALVIGNSAYKNNAALKNPRNDAEAIADKLNALGFRVIKGIDVDKYTMETLVRSFSNELQSARIALFFYAGHGLRVSGENYILPVDASLSKEADLDFEAMKLNLVLSQMERGQRTNIVLLDACRNNPLAKNLAANMGTRSASIGRGLARVNVGVGTFIGFATQPDRVALDGSGSNSPFTTALLKHIDTPGLDIEVMMRKVRQEVIDVTNGEQVPWSRSSLVGDQVVLKPALAVASPDPVAPVKAAVPTFPSQIQPQVSPSVSSDRTADKALELAFWNSVRDSKNPELYNAYLQQFPNGTFSSLARTMVAIYSAAPAKPKVVAKPVQEAPKVAALSQPQAEPKFELPGSQTSRDNVAAVPEHNPGFDPSLYSPLGIPYPRIKPADLLPPGYVPVHNRVVSRPVIEEEPVRRKTIRKKRIIKKRVIRKKRVYKKKQARRRRPVVEAPPSRTRLRKQPRVFMDMGSKARLKKCPQCLTK